MFESSLLQTRNPKSTRWIALTSVIIQATTLAVFLIVPLLWPETLPLVSIAPKMTSLTLRKPEVKIQPKPQPVVADSAYHAPVSAQPMVESRGTRFIRQGSPIVEAMSEPSFTIGNVMGSANHPIGIGGPGDGTRGSGPVVIAATAKTIAPLKISQGVSAGLLLAPIHPVYPRIAVISRVEGTVVVTAIIDKRGHITGLQILSGPDMLKAAAADAVREAHYRPYLLNGEPTEVVTTISVNFRMGS